jgi:hypothetical protein
MIDRYGLLIRAHAVAVRVDLSAAGGTQSIGANISHMKPGTIEPDGKILQEVGALERPMMTWLRRTEESCNLTDAGQTLERFHAAIVATNERNLGALIDAMEQTETRLRIKWDSGTQSHGAMPTESLDALRTRMETTYLFRHFGKTTKTAAEDENVSEGTMDHVRRKHGIRKLNGHRADRCPEAVVQHSVHDFCAICQVVDDLMGHESKAA